MVVKSRDEMWRDFTGLIGVRGRKTLLRMKITSFEELAEKTIEDFLQIKGFGCTSLHLLRERAKDYGVKILSSHEKLQTAKPKVPEAGETGRLRFVVPDDFWLKFWAGIIFASDQDVTTFDAVGHAQELLKRFKEQPQC